MKHTKKRMTRKRGGGRNDYLKAKAAKGNVNATKRRLNNQRAQRAHNEEERVARNAQEAANSNQFMRNLRSRQTNRTQRREENERRIMEEALQVEARRQEMMAENPMNAYSTEIGHRVSQFMPKNIPLNQSLSRSDRPSIAKQNFRRLNSAAPAFYPKGVNPAATPFVPRQ